MSTPVTSMSPAELQKAAREHLWLHFTRMSSYTGEDIPIIVRGDGCYLEDVHGNRYLDALAGLFSVNIGYGFGEEIGQAALEQLRETLNLEALPLRIECFDVSTAMGQDTVGALVVFQDGLPKKAHYRKFPPRGPAGRHASAPPGRAVPRPLPGAGPGRPGWTC